MGAVLLSPIYILLIYYLAVRMLRWFATLHPALGSRWFAAAFCVCLIFAALTPLLAVFGHGIYKASMKRISNYWLGILMYLLIFLLLTDCGRIVYRLLRHHSVMRPFDAASYRLISGIAIAAAAVLSAYGICHALEIRVAHYEAAVQKSCPLSSLKIALVADLHLGYSVGPRHVQRVCDAIESIRPDLVVYAGDMFDNDYEAVQNPEETAAILGSVKSTYGSFACWGNHDISELILAGFTFSSGDSSVSYDPRMRAFLEDAGIRVLEDETVLVDDLFYISGRLDASWPEKTGQERLSADELLSPLDDTKPVFVIDHQPSELSELSEAGADLALSGHTHDGQIFPGNLTTRIGWENSRGKLVLGSMTSIVTSGAGIWGPAMRVGTDSEVAAIEVKFAARLPIDKFSAV